MSTSYYRFNFTSTRSYGQMLQLQEVRLYSPDGMVDLSTARATNPYGSSPSNHPVSNVIDGDVGSDDCVPSCEVYTRSSKWLDFNTMDPCVDNGDDLRCTRSADRSPYSVLDITLDRSILLASYELITARDAPVRDPTTWTVWRRVGGQWELLDGSHGAYNDYGPGSPDGPWPGWTAISPPYERLASYGTGNSALIGGGVGGAVLAAALILLGLGVHRWRHRALRKELDLVAVANARYGAGSGGAGESTAGCAGCATPPARSPSTPVTPSAAPRMPGSADSAASCTRSGSTLLPEGMPPRRGSRT